ncbi:unnamed protein product, partial [marine sediment metagenome]
ETDKVMRGIDAPTGFWECDVPQKRDETIKRNMRAILQLFNIKVLVCPERVEIKGAIPTQVLDKPTGDESKTALIISSPSLIKGRGKLWLKRE